MRRVRPIAAGLAGLLIAGLFVLTGAPASARPEPMHGVTGASVVLPDDAVTIYVDASVPATDYYPFTGVWPAGTAEQPYPNFYWGIAAAKNHRTAGSAVHLLVAPGTYRETIDIGWAGDDAPPLLIEPLVPGTVTVSGADVEARWTKVPGADLFEAPWDDKWGLTSLPSSWSGVNVPEMVRRREAVFVGDESLAQVRSVSDLTPGTFTVDEGAGRIYAMPPAGVADLADEEVEVARREFALRIRGLAESVAVRGITFEKAATPLQSYMAYVTSSTNILIEDNTFRLSSWSGLGVGASEDVTIRGNRAVDNGGNGLDTYSSKNVIVESNRVTGNNVRGFRNGFVGWSTAGSKSFVMNRAVFRDNVYEGNFARGLWFDTDVSDILIEGDRSIGNYSDGLFIEAVQGPITVRDSVFEGNGGGGVVTGSASGVSIESSLLADNGYGQLVLSGAPTRTFVSFLDGLVRSVLQVEDLTLVGNTLRSPGAAPLLYSPAVTITDWLSLLTGGEVVASGNTWVRPSEIGAIKIQATLFSLADWRLATGDSATFDDMSEPAPQADPNEGATPAGDQGTEPEVTEPEVTEPEVTEPEVTEPEVTEPEVAEPEVTGPEVAEPQTSAPLTSEREVTQPEVAEPEVPEPQVTGDGGLDSSPDRATSTVPSPRLTIRSVIVRIVGFLTTLFNW